MQTRPHLHALFLLLLYSAATAAEAQVRPELAKRYFEEAMKLCERDAGRPCGVSLCGPMVIVDQESCGRLRDQAHLRSRELIRFAAAPDDFHARFRYD